MTLLITVFAAIAATLAWYHKAPCDKMHLGTLCLMFWGASLMWMVDAIAEYIELGAEFFSPPLEDMINDLYLGLSVVALGLIIWLIIVLIKDPKGILRASILNK